MKPNTTQAMHELIGQIKTALPVELKAGDVCKDHCNICSMKLVEYLTMELENWEYRLANGDVPNFKDLSKLAKSGRNIHKALKKNGIID